MKRYLLELAGETSEHGTIEEACFAAEQKSPFMTFGRDVRHEAGYLEWWGTKKEPPKAGVFAGVSGFTHIPLSSCRIIAVDCKKGKAAAKVEKLRRKLEEKRAAVLREHDEYTRNQPPLVIEGYATMDDDGLALDDHPDAFPGGERNLSWAIVEHFRHDDSSRDAIGKFRITIECLGVDA